MPPLFTRDRSTTHRPLVAVGLAAILAVLALSAFAWRGVSVPAPSGPHPVGRTTYRWTDTSRPEVMTTDPDDQRAVVVHVWYPAEAGRGWAARPAAYLPDHAALRPALAQSPEFGVLNAWAIGLVRAHAVEEAPIANAEDAFPVLIFLAGNRTNAGLYAALLEDLASHGYVVAAIDHPYDVEAVRLPNGQTAVFGQERWPPLGDETEGLDSPHLRFYRERVEVRAQDAVFALAQMAALNAASGGPLGGHLDLDRVGVLGHSVGGVAASRVCQMAPGVGACLNIDGLTGGLAFYPDANGRGPAQPFMLLTKPGPVPSDGVLAQWQLTRAEWQALASEAEAQQAALFATVAGGSYRVTLLGAQHDSFTDAPLLAPGVFNARQPEAGEHMESVRAYVRAFFDHYIRKGEAGPLAVVGTESVEVEVFGK